MPAPENRLPPPSREALARLCSALGGTEVLRVRSLSGGLDAAMHAVNVRGPAGTMRVVVRRHGLPMQHVEPLSLERGWRTLQALEGIDYPAPRPLLFDGDGSLLGAPGYVMTRLPGRGDLEPRDPRSWTRQLAATLATLHRVQPEDLEIDVLPGPSDSAAALLGPVRVARIESTALGREVLAVVDRDWSRNVCGPARLCHGDYWPGNTLWRRGRLTGVVDWDSARIEVPYGDVGYCRLDMALCQGQEYADLFLSAYEEESEAVVPDPSFWDLLAALRALPDPSAWLPTYDGLGRRDVTIESLRDRLEAFVRRALDR